MTDEECEGCPTAFDRDHFVVGAPLFSANEKHVVWDHEGRPLLFVDSPSRVGRLALAIALAAGAVLCDRLCPDHADVCQPEASATRQEDARPGCPGLVRDSRLSGRDYGGCSLLGRLGISAVRPPGRRFPGPATRGDPPRGAVVLCDEVHGLRRGRRHRGPAVRESPLRSMAVALARIPPGSIAMVLRCGGVAHPASSGAWRESQRCRC